MVVMWYVIKYFIKSIGFRIFKQVHKYMPAVMPQFISLKEHFWWINNAFEYWNTMQNRTNLAQN